MIVLLVSFSLLALYVLLMVPVSIGWFRLPVHKHSGKQPEVKVSVVVAARNEAQNIKALLLSLIRQDYPATMYEIIIVDDHSQDDTYALASALALDFKSVSEIKILQLPDNLTGKKAALQQGIHVSNGELIVITDADCISGPRWLRTMAEHFSIQKPQLILGPVLMQGKGKLTGTLQTLEFTSLLATAAGSCHAGFPLLANGANIAFSRKAFYACGGFEDNKQFASGDDMFLMLAISKKYGARAVTFLRSEDAMVITPAASSLGLFIQQRLRWVSKSKGYSYPLLVSTSLLVFFTNSMLAFLAIAALFSPSLAMVFILFITGKTLAELPLMLSYSRFQGTVRLMWWFPVLQIFNAFYTLIIGIAGNIMAYEWKGRKNIKALKT